MEQRDFVILNLPFPLDEPITHPEKVIIQFSNNKSLDLGALCYLKREDTKSLGHNTRSRKNIRCRPVDLSSFYPKRTKHIGKIIRYLSEQLTDSGKRLQTIRDTIGRFIPFMDWMDKSDHIDALDNVELAKNAVFEYLKYLLERVKLGEIALDSAISQQERVIRVLQDHFNAEDFSHGLPLLGNNLSKKNPTPPPDERKMSETLNLCKILFESLSSFVLEFKKYPYSILVPEHYKYPNNKLWIFPTTSWFKHPSTPYSKLKGAFNYEEGRIFTLTEAEKVLSIKRKCHFKRSINSSKIALETANNNKRSKCRIEMGHLALQCFIVMFQAETGMNWSQIVNLRWEDNYDIDSPRQLFKGIKWRAENRDVYFEISSKFLLSFKKFLILRKFIINENNFPFLFPKINSNDPNHFIHQLPEHQLSLYCKLKRIYPDLTHITNKEWRSAKSHWLIRNTDPSTTSLILQNSEKTVLAHYAAGSETSQIIEFGNFLDSLSKTVHQPIGACSDFLAPSQIISSTSINSNCKTLEGCLFCEKFRIHADEIDTRKLLSCKYCLEKISANFQGERYYEDTINPLLNRIDEILKIIRNENKMLVEQIEADVQLNGNLEFYWAQKFQMLLELEVIQ